MKRIWTMLVALFCIGFQLRAEVEVPRLSPLPRQIEKERVSLAGTWQFNGKDRIEVPGEWVMQGFEMEKGKEAIYERSFRIPSSWKGQRVKLRCNGIYSKSRIAINGREVGSHLGGFTAFELDVTEAVAFGKENRIKVGVTSESVADSTSSGTAYAVHPLGGITRDIYLFALPTTNLASFHVQTLLDTLYTDATLKAEVEIAEETEATGSPLSLRFQLKDAAGKTVFEKREKAVAGKGTYSFAVENPAKWTSETPVLYTLSCSLEKGGKELYTTVRKVGFRQIEVRGNQVFVNNRPIKLRGVCRHEVMPLRGRSLAGNIWEEDVKLFQEGNVNYIRTSHYPPDEALLEACDKLGMFVEVEAPFCWAHQTEVQADDSAIFVTQHIEMLNQYRSHPSILMWSMGNESLKFKECFSRAAEIVKEMDPTRPRIFSQWGPEADDEMLEITNHHYPGPKGPEKYRNAKRPVVFDEYCHNNAYNRLELSADPGLRSKWGELLDAMWDAMYHSQGVLGGAIWAGIDDTFFLPGGRAVGYGTWGVIDGWRREKPEYWGMKKAYSPVRIALKGNMDKEGRLAFDVENRHNFLDISACRIIWKAGDKQGTISGWNLPARTDSILSLQLPESVRKSTFLDVEVYAPQGYLMDAYHFQILPTAVMKEVVRYGELSLKEDGSGITVSSLSGDYRIDLRNGLLEGLRPNLVLLPLNGEGRGIQMLGGGQNFDPYTPMCANWIAKSFETRQSEDCIEVCVSGEYEEAEGTLTYCFLNTGKVEIAYDFVLKEAISPRQVGIALALPADFTHLSWERKGYWSVYPKDHIAALEGSAEFMNPDLPVCGLAGPDQQPSVSWALDQTEYGSNNFRSTKENIYTAVLSSPQSGKSLKVESDGTQHVRCWKAADGFRLLVADYNNAGSDQFLVSHAEVDYRPLRRGDRVQGKITFKW